MIEGGELFRRHDDVAPHRQNQHAGAEPQRAGMRGDKGVGDQRLPKTRRHRKLRAHIVLRRHVIVAPDRMIAEPLGVLSDTDHRLRLGKRNRIGEPLHAGRQTGTDNHTHALSSLRFSAVSRFIFARILVDRAVLAQHDA